MVVPRGNFFVRETNDSKREQKKERELRREPSLKRRNRPTKISSNEVKLHRVQDESMMITLLLYVSPNHIKIVERNILGRMPDATTRQHTCSANKPIFSSCSSPPSSFVLVLFPFFFVDQRISHY